MTQTIQRFRVDLSQTELLYNSKAYFMSIPVIVLSTEETVI